MITMTDDDTPKLHTTDQALLDAAAGKANPVGFVELTPALMKTIGAAITERTADIASRYPALVEGCPYETRLAVAAWVFKAIVDHAQEGGSFRYLIYNRLGFQPDAYLPLYEAGGMTISNEFDLTKERGDGQKDQEVAPAQPSTELPE
jgi:hypothetical protein